MCGIVGLYLKNEALQPRLGALFAPMLIAMGDRGPDSAGFAIYGDEAPDGATKITLRSTSESAERQSIARALNRTDGNAEAAARLLGVSRATVYRKIKKYRLAQG